MADIEQSPIINATNGNISLHGQEGKQFTLFFQDEEGAPRDMTEASVVLQIKGRPPIESEPGDTDDSVKLTIMPSDLTTLIGKATPFAWLDMTSEVPDAFWTGLLIVRGF